MSWLPFMYGSLVTSPSYYYYYVAMLNKPMWQTHMYWTQNTAKKGDGRDHLDLRSSYEEQWLILCSQVKAQHKPISNCLLWAALRTEHPSSMFIYV